MTPEMKALHSQRMRDIHAAKRAAKLEGVPYVPPAKPEVIPPLTPLPLEPAPPVLPVPAPATPNDLFKAWMRTPVGLDASDPRMSQDQVRRGCELEDRLRVAFNAGYVEGVVS